MTSPIDRAAEELDPVAMDSPADYPLAHEEATTTARTVFESIDPDDLAKVLSDNWRNMHSNESLGQQRMLADAVLAWLTGKDQT